ncbi:hypothetical protein [Streptomyces sp. NPDC004008]
MEHEHIAKDFARLRADEFGYLDAGGHIYLDHTGAGLLPRSLVTGSAERITGGLFGNPHSESPASRSSGRLPAEARRAVLRHFRADPAEYTVVFTSIWRCWACPRRVRSASPWECRPSRRTWTRSCASCVRPTATGPRPPTACRRGRAAEHVGGGGASWPRRGCGIRRPVV